MRSLYLTHKSQSQAFEHYVKDRLIGSLLSFIIVLPLLLLSLNLVIFIKWLNYVIILIGLVLYLMMVLADIIYYKWLASKQNLPYRHIVYYHMILYGIGVVVLVGIAILLKGFLL